MKGKIVLRPLHILLLDIKVVYNNQIHTVYDTFNHAKTCALDPDCKLVAHLDEVKELAVEWEGELPVKTQGQGKNEPGDMGTYQLPIPYSQWPLALENLGEEVEFVHWTGGRREANEPEVHEAWIQIKSIPQRNGLMGRYWNKTPDGYVEAAAFAIYRDLRDRSGVGNAIEACDTEIQEEMLQMMVDKISETFQDT